MFRSRTGCLEITKPPPSKEECSSKSTCSVTSIINKTVSYFRKRRDGVNLEHEDDLWIDLNTPLLGSNGAGYGT